MSKLLINEQPLLCQPSLAVALGSADEAIVLQQLHYWLSRTTKVQSDGNVWVYNSISDWLKQFPWIKTRSRLARYFDDLEEKGLIITGDFNKAKFDKTKWYRIDYDALQEFEQRLYRNDTTNASKQDNGVHQNDTRSVSKRYSAVSQNDATYTNRLPETTTRDYQETTTEKNKGTAQPAMALAAQRREVIKYLNEVTGKKFKPNADGNKRVIDPRLKEGYTVADLKHIIDVKYAEWHGKTFSNGKPGDFYMRPETLFRVSKIESYHTEEIPEKATAQGENGDPLYDDPWFKH